MEQASSSGAHASFLRLPGDLIESILGQSVQTWVTGLHKSISRLWSSLQYRTEFGNPSIGSWTGDKSQDPIPPTQKEPILRDPEGDTRCVRKEDAEMVMGRLGLCSTGEWDGWEGTGPGEISRLFEEEEPSLQEVREAFRVFDVNEDGFIDAAELQRVLRGLGLVEEGKEVEDCRRMIRAFDENGDGRIDFNEFVKLMENCFC